MSWSVSINRQARSHQALPIPAPRLHAVARRVYRSIRPVTKKARHEMTGPFEPLMRRGNRNGVLERQHAQFSVSSVSTRWRPL